MSPAPAPRPVAVFAHVHHPEIWDGMATLLAERLRQPFHLLATTSGPAAAVALPRTAAMLGARVLPVENRGRDILPFLRALRAAEPFDVGLKLHTKKSPQRDDGAEWRAAMLDSLLPPGGGVGAIVDALRAEPRVGLVAPGGFALSVPPWVLQNRRGMDAVAGALGAEGTAADMADCVFAAGSMFWFRRDALHRLAADAVTALFEPEEGQLDGTVAHAMERVFPVEARRQGFVSLAVPALLQSRPGMATAALRDLARRHADVPSTFFPAPYVPALPVGTPLPPPLLPSSPLPPQALPAAPRLRERVLRRAGRLLPGPARDRLRRLLWPPVVP